MFEKIDPNDAKVRQADEFVRATIANIRTAQAHLATQHEREARAAHKPVPTLVDQLRDLFVTLPPAQRNKVSIPMLLPHLQGRWREHPHPLHIARALRLLGYRQIRTWTSDAYGARWWVAPDSPQTPTGD